MLEWSDRLRRIVGPESRRWNASAKPNRQDQIGLEEEEEEAALGLVYSLQRPRTRINRQARARLLKLLIEESSAGIRLLVPRLQIRRTGVGELTLT